MAVRPSERGVGSPSTQGAAVGRGGFLAWWAAAVPLAALLALAHAMAQPYWNNQNQYFAHVLGDRRPALAQDWLVGTVDPYPLFTGLAGQLLDAAGIPGLRAWSLAVTAAGVLGVGYIARQLSSSRSLWPSYVAMIVGGLTLSPLVSGANVPSAYRGVAGQYLLSVPGYVQPASAGVALLFTVGILLRDCDRRRQPGWPGTAAAAATAGIACAIHPTYAVVVLVGLAGALVVDLTLATTERLRTYTVLAVTSVVAAFLANPALADLGSSATGDNSSLTRFAFERIPHHTLLTEWDWAHDWLVVLVVAAGAAAVRPLRHGTWMARWLALCLAGSLAAAALVWATRWPSMALLFPWRITAVLMPVAVAALCVGLAELAFTGPATRWPAVRRIVLAGLAVLLSITAFTAVQRGLAATREAPSPAESAPVRAVAAAQPTGVGLVPLEVGLVRLNAGYPIFVDWRSPPYASADLDEWWRRIDLVREVQADLRGLCSAAWRQRVDWVLLPAQVAIPDCLTDWPVTADEAGWRVIEEP